MQSHVAFEDAHVDEFSVADLTATCLRFLGGMRLGVFREVVGRGELLRADVTDVHSLDGGVLQHVTLHLVGPPKPLVTDGASERRRQVDPGVLVQPSLLQELLAAHLAAVRALGGVERRVRAQLRQAEELLPARAAREARLVAVRDHVRPQRRRQRELPAADLARERSLGDVLVPVQVANQRELLMADVAAERLLAGVVVHVNGKRLRAVELLLTNFTSERTFSGKDAFVLD